MGWGRRSVLCLRLGSSCSATTVDDIFAEAKVTKGGFFHYFKSKEDIAREAAAYFTAEKSKEIMGAAFRKLPDPLGRIYGRLEFVQDYFRSAKQMNRGCLVGAFAQEAAFTYPHLKEACRAAFTEWTKDFEVDLAEAKALYAPKADFEPIKIARLYLSIFQGSLIMAKTEDDTDALIENITEFRRYLKSLLGDAGAMRERCGRQERREWPSRRNPSGNHEPRKQQQF
jgi:TetR/AcrR family transcriptional repressor of nem operon